MSPSTPTKTKNKELGPLYYVRNGRLGTDHRARMVVGSERKEDKGRVLVEVVYDGFGHSKSTWIDEATILGPVVSDERPKRMIVTPEKAEKMRFKRVRRDVQKAEKSTRNRRKAIKEKRQEDDSHVSNIYRCLKAIGHRDTSTMFDAAVGSNDRCPVKLEEGASEEDSDEEEVIVLPDEDDEEVIELSD